MARIRNIDLRNIKESRLPLIIGYFGSVHVMHAQLFNRHHRFNVLTFNDFSNKANSQIYPFKDRLANIERFKPQNIFVFNIEKNNMTAQEFIQKVLLKINPSTIFVGSNFKFGYDDKTYEILKTYFDVQVLNYNQRISSSIVADLLCKGEVEKANSLLYFPYFYQSKWVSGFHRGEQVGAKTINLLVDHRICLPEGSYVSKITIGPWTYRAVTFFGRSPVFNVQNQTLESHIIGGTLVPRVLLPKSVKDNVRVNFYKFIRAPQFFNSVNELSTAIKRDISIAKEYFEQHKK